MNTFKRQHPRSRSLVEPCHFCVRRGNFSRFRVQGGQECPFEDRNVVAIMFTMPGRISGDRPFLTLFAETLLLLGSPPLHMGWDTALPTERYPHVHLVPLNVGQHSPIG